MTTEPKVYLPSVPTRHDPLTNRQVPTVDLSKAEAFGQLVPMTELWPLEGIPSALESIADKMQDFTPNDFIVAIGDVVLIAAAISYACDIHGSVKLLRWDKLYRTYKQEIIEL